MSLPDAIRDLARRLRRTVHFEAAAHELLDELAAFLAADTEAASARIARGIVHARTQGVGYRALVMRSFGEGTDTQVAPSATVWSCVERTGEAVALDLGTCVGVTLRDPSAVETVAAFVDHASSGSVSQMLAREVTHVLAFPLRTAGTSGGELSGMVCLELVWPTQVGRPLVPRPAWVDAQTLVELSAMHLAALPFAAPAVRDDVRHPLLPVVGERTRQLVRVLRVFVDQDETLLISGPTGAGKSRLAEWCHRVGKRSAGPFETANLLAVPETMQLAELFGWKRGAFTGAHGDHEGLVAASEGGTLFLDEIDKLSLAAQAGLLRLLETRRFSPLGSSRERSANVRFIVATNADLRDLVARGLFRGDLYYRVNVLPARLDGLHERADEIPAWADVMLARRHREAGGHGEIAFRPEAQRRLLAYDWPGNLRQLDNVVRRAYALFLADRGPGAQVSWIDVRDVEQALTFEAPTAPEVTVTTTDEALRVLADRLVDHALEERRAGRTLELERLDVLRAAVLRAAVERVGSVKDAYLLFGAEALVASRNHTGAYKKLLETLAELEETLRAHG